VKTFLGAIASDDYEAACEALSSASHRDIVRTTGSEDRCPEYLRSQFKLPGRGGNASYRDAQLNVAQQVGNTAIVNAQVPERRMTLPVAKSGDVWKLQLVQR
jgi:hypothetical protein